MSQNPNPYASPQYTGSAPVAPMGPAAAGLWRQGDYLVIDKRIQLPDICLLTNEPARERQSVSYQYLPPSVRWLGAGFGLIGAAIAQAFAVNATVNMPVSDTVIGQRWQAAIFGFGGAILGIALFVGGCVAMANKLEALGIVGMLAGAVALIGGIIAAVVLYKQVQSYFINETHIWISGAHADYLNRLPHWPYEHV